MNKRRTIIDPTQLASMPEGTILMDRDGFPLWLDETFGWCGANGNPMLDLPCVEDLAPFVILYQPGVENADTGGISAEPSDAEIRAAAEAIARCTFPDKGWRELSPWKREYNTKRARAALVAARKAREVSGR